MIASLGIAGSVFSQSVYPGLFNAETVVAESGNKVVECFPLSDVRLLDSRFRENMRRDSAWMMSVEADRLLHSFYNTSGVFAGKEGGIYDG